MAMPPVNDWIDGFAGLTPAGIPDWATNMADLVDSLVTGKVALMGLTGSVTFTFNKAAFMAALLTISIAPSAAIGAQNFATAWQMGMLASTIVVAPGAFIGVSTPPTLFSVVASSILDPVGIVAGKAILSSNLATALPVSDAQLSVIGPSFFAAFSLCSSTVTGMNSVSPPIGPLPLTAPLLLFI